MNALNIPAWIACLCAVLNLGAIDHAQHPPTPYPAQNHALFFAVDAYPNGSGWSRLKNPIRDAEAIAKELGEVYDFKTKVVRNPSRAEIFRTLEAWQRKRFEKDAQLLVFFSGHGTFSETFKEGFFIPLDGKGETADPYHDTHIALNRIGNLVTSIPCEHVLLAIDACYSGTIDREIAFRGKPAFNRPKPTPGYDVRQDVIKDQLRNKTRLLLTSGGKERTPDGVDHSPFAGTLLKALRRAYAYEDGMATYTDLLALMERLSPKPHHGELPGHQDGGFVFARPKVTRDLPGPPMAFIQGGTFTMGCTSEQQDCGSDEKPTFQATVSDFYLGKHEVTVGDFSRFVNATQYQTDAEKGDGSFIWTGSKWEKRAGVNWRHDVEGKERPASSYNHPVIYVSWNDAVAYCNWLSGEHGLQPVYTINGGSVSANWQANGFRLPTEAEWEYAARQRGEQVLFGNGKNTLDPAEVNFDASSYYKKPYSIVGTYRGETVPVGSLNSPNRLGLHDMSGNVWEWCWDWKDTYPSRAQTDYRGPASGSDRVIRGGSWSSVPQYCRVANRFNSAPDYRVSFVGFRLARH